MVPWTRLAGPAEAFTRPLGNAELMFYWDAAFAGTSDLLHQVTVEAEASQASRVFSPTNIARAWVGLKQLHPLLGATVSERGGSTANVDFSVDKARLDVVGLDEIIFQASQWESGALSFVERILNEPRTLSNERPAQLWVIPLHGRPGAAMVRVQFLLLTAHYVCDGMAQIGIEKTFLDLLSFVDTQEMHGVEESLEARLALVPAVEDLSPTLNYPPARQRWRLAIARIIYSIRTATLRGGHTLPRAVTPQTPHTAAISRSLRVTLPKDLSIRIIASCRRENITIGCALPVLAQLAHARVLHWLHSHELVSVHDWEYMKQQPTHVSGPVNLRPYLNPEWIAHGGIEMSFVAMADDFGNTLPALKTSPSSLPSILSRTGFVERCRWQQRQMARFVRHPLFMEFSKVGRPARISVARATALEWRKKQPEDKGFVDLRRSVQELLSETTTSSTGEYVRANTCSTFGNVDKMLPSEYPLESGGSPKRESPIVLRTTSITPHIRCRPAELYLSSMMYHQEIQLLAFCDARVYEETLAQKWLSEIGTAAEWYLGKDFLGEGVVGVQGEVQARL